MSVNDSDYSDSDDESNSSVISDIEIVPKKKLNAINIETEDDDEDEISINSESSEDLDHQSVDDDESENEDLQIGGAGDDLEEAEIDENENPESEDDDEENNDNDFDETGEPLEKKSTSKSVKSTKPKKNPQLIIQDDEDEDDEYDENYLQKFDSEITKNYIEEFHPECLNHNYEEIAKLSTVVRNSDNIIIDPLHRTIPFLTKYEKARILGQRAKQIESGAKPFIKLNENIIDSYIIAEFELREKKIPFIIKRPLPSGCFEYWNIKDLENIGF